MATLVGQAILNPNDLQTVDVAVVAGYRPNLIRARAGVPLRIVFHRDDDDPCTERVVFSEPKLDRRLAAHGVTTVDLPARESGDIRFTCGMGRYRGRIEIVERHRWSLADRWRHLGSRASLLRDRVRRGLRLTIAAAPLVLAGLGFLFLRPAVAILFAATALAVWGAQLWATRASMHPAPTASLVVRSQEATTEHEREAEP